MESEDDLSLSTDYSSMIVTRMFRKRKSAFQRSLQSILIQVSHDPIVRNLLQDKASSQFISNRIEEIIKDVLVDDREKFIDVLLQKLQAFETLYSAEHTKNIRELGSRMISVSDEQTTEEISNIRRIQLLIEQVNSLQKELVTLRAKKTDDLVNVDEIDGKTRPRRYRYDPASPQFYHIYARVDLTNFELKVKMIQTESKAVREMMVVLSNKMKQIFSVVKTKTLQNAKSLERRVEAADEAVKRANAKAAELQKHFDKSVIPQLINKQKETVTKYKKMLQQRLGEIEKLKLQLAETNANLKESNTQGQQLKNIIASLEQQHEEDENHINTLQDEKINNKQSIQEKNEEIAQNNKLIDQLKEQNANLTSILQSSQDEGRSQKEKLHQKDLEIQKLTRELQELKEQVPKAKEVNDNITKELNQTKDQKFQLEQQLNDTQQRNQELDEKIQDLTPKLEQTTNDLQQTKNQLQRAQAEIESKDHQIEEKNDEIANKTQQIIQLEKIINDAKLLSQKQDDEITNLQLLNNQHSTKIESLQNKLKSANQTNDQLRKEIQDHEQNATRQNSKISEVGQLKSQLENEKEKLERANNKLSSELKKTKKDLEDVEAELSKLNQAKQQMQQQISQQVEAQDEMQQKLRKLKSQLKDAENKVEDEVAAAKEHKSKNTRLATHVNELEDDLKSMQLEKQRSDKQLRENEQAIHKLERENANLDKDLRAIKEKANQQAEMNRDQQKKLDNLTNSNNQMQKVLNDIQHVVQTKNLKDLPKVIQGLFDGNNLAEQIMKLLGTRNYDEVIQVLNEMKKQSETLKIIQDLLPINDPHEFAQKYNAMEKDNELLKAEQKRISQLLSTEAGVDISKTIQEIIEKQSKVQEQLTNAAEFISTILTIMTGPSLSQTRLVFPLKKTMEDKLIDLVTRIKKRADNDHEKIEELFSRANALGYDGDDVIEAAEFIAMRTSETERQITLQTVGQQLGDVRNISQTEAQAYQKERAQSKKMISKLRESLQQQMDQTKIKEEELLDQIDDLKKHNRRLQSDLETEKHLREELGRLGAGLPADQKFLRSKLNEKEFHLMELGAKIMQNDTESGIRTGLKSPRSPRQSFT